MRDPMNERDALIVRIYEAVTEPGTWPAVMEAIGQALNAQSSVIALSDMTKRDASFAFTTGVMTDQALISMYDQYQALDPALPYFTNLPAGEVDVTSRIWTRRERESSTFYQDYYTKECQLFDFMAVNLVNDSSRAAIAGVQRAVGQPAFDDKDLALMKQLAPHLRRAFDLHRVFVGLSRTRDAFHSIVDRLTVAAFMIDSAERVVFCNRRAEALIAANDGMNIDRSGRLTISHPGAARQVANAVRAIVLGPGSPIGARINVLRPSGRRPLAVIVSRAPLPARERDPSALPYAFVLVQDPDQIQPDFESAMAAFDFTKRESELLKALVAGSALKEHCDATGISINTGRFHLKSLFAKTGARSQSDLLRIVLTAMPPLAPEQS